MQIMRGRWVKCTTHSDALAFVSQRRGEKKRCCGWAWHPRCNSAINVGAVPKSCQVRLPSHVKSANVSIHAHLDQVKQQ